MPSNLVVLMADQLRYDALGAQTPRLNALRGESVRFERAYTVSALCVPARGAFFTGLYPAQNGCLVNQFCPEAYVRADCGNLYELFEGDWDSWHSGKQHFRSWPVSLEHRKDGKTRFISTTALYADFLQARGLPMPGGPAFRGMCPETAQNGFPTTHAYSIPATGRYEPGFSAYYDGYFAEKAVEAIRNRDKTKPLLLNVMFLAPHPPLEVPAPYDTMVGEGDFTLPENVGRWYGGQSPYQLRHAPGFLGAQYTREDWQRIWRYYLGLTALLDDCVGMVLDALQSEGIYDDTLIVFASDHGEMLGSHRLWQKMCLYEESARTPLWFRLPAGERVQPGDREAVVSAVDVLPTLCAYFGRYPKNAMSGQSLLPCIRDAACAPVRDASFVQYDGNVSLANTQRAIVTQKEKLIVSREPDGCFFELYRMDADPQETDNRLFSGGGAALAAARTLYARLRTHLRETGDPCVLEESALDRFWEAKARSGYAIPSHEVI